jgi:hypothetical protein
MKQQLSGIELHSAGAIIRHESIFSHLTSYENDHELSDDFRKKWVIPFYFNLNKTDQEWINSIRLIKHDITDSIILENLGDFNWRTRSTGSFFAAIKNAQQYTDIIGNHLLKSEVCFAGATYAKTLASFNTPQAINYLNCYLDYYLTRWDLEFDQVSVITALTYIDNSNSTNYCDRHRSNWELFTDQRRQKAQTNFDKMKPTLKEEQLASYYRHVEFWNGKIDTTSFSEQMTAITQMKTQIDD